MPQLEQQWWKSKKRTRKTFKTDRALIVHGQLRLELPRGTQLWYDIKLAELPRWRGDIQTVCIVTDADGVVASL